MYTNFNISVFKDTLTNLLYFYDLIISNIEITLIFEIAILGATIFMANRLGDKVLKGLQGAAATTIIARGILDAINSMGGEDEKTNKEDSKTKQENNNSNSEPNNSDSNNSDKNSSNKSDADDKGQGEGK
jgi:hypothetical protein